MRVDTESNYDQLWADASPWPSSILSAPPTPLLLAESLAFETFSQSLDLPASHCHGPIVMDIAETPSSIILDSGASTSGDACKGDSNEKAELLTPECPPIDDPNTMFPLDVEYLLNNLPADQSIDANLTCFDPNRADVLSFGFLDSLVCLDGQLSDSAINNVHAAALTNAVGVSLKHVELWSRLHDLTNEMIVSTKGRQLFPPIEATIQNLSPEKKYRVWLRFECDDIKGSGWRWCDQGGWQLMRKMRRANSSQCNGHGAGVSGQDFYTPAGGPLSGHQIITEGISFAQVKITNKPNTKGAIFIESFHSYVPVIYIAPVEDDSATEIGAGDSHAQRSHIPQELSLRPSNFFRYPLQLCRFIACTAYHNKELAQIKILANPQTRGTRVLGNITPTLAQEFVNGDLATKTDIGKHKENFLRHCAMMTTTRSQAANGLSDSISTRNSNLDLPSTSSPSLSTAGQSLPYFSAMLSPQPIKTSNLSPIGPAASYTHGMDVFFGAGEALSFDRAANANQCLSASTLSAQPALIASRNRSNMSPVGPTYGQLPRVCYDNEALSSLACVLPERLPSARWRGLIPSRMKE